MEYKIIFASEWGCAPTKQLEKMVSDAILDGWEPLGSVCHSFQNGLGAAGQIMCQAMVRKYAKTKGGS